MDDLDRQIREAAGEIGTQDQEVEQDVALDESDDSVVEDVAGSVEPASSAIEAAPQSWGAATKAAWERLPAEVRKEILKRETDISKGFEKHAQKSKQYESWAQAFEPIRGALAHSGMDERQYVERAIAVDRFLQEQPAEAIKWLAGQYRIDLSNLMPQQQPAMPEGSGVDPSILQRFNTLEQQNQQFQRQMQQQQLDQAAARVNAFISDPEHKYVNEAAVGNELANSVIQDMLVFLQADPAKDLGNAYAKAIRVNEQAAQAVAQERAAKAAEKAKRKPTNVKTNGAAGRPGNVSLDDAVRASIDEFRARARA